MKESYILCEQLIEMFKQDGNMPKSLDRAIQLKKTLWNLLSEEEQKEVYNGK